MTQELRLQLKGISKFFPGVRALNKVSLDVYAGEVHALCGENGAGKSTLMNILSGNLKPDEGSILLNGQEIVIKSPLHAQSLGIAIVYQERSLVETLSVAENIYVENQPHHTAGFIHFKKLYSQTAALLNRLGLSSISPTTPVSMLSPARKQMVEIAKALSRNPQILILDEPTASITEAEVKILFQIIRELKAQGISVIYISHRMSEIFQISDRVSVLKDGHYQGTINTNELTVNEVIKQMVGRDLLEQEYQTYVQPQVLLEVQNLSGNTFHQINFQLHKGEIVGLAGLVGAGRTEVARAIFGADPIVSGQILLEGKPVRITHPADAIELGIAYLPEERKDKGLFLEMSIANNVVSAGLKQVASNSFINRKAIQQLALAFKNKLNIITPSIEQKVLNLSGGNQQKVVLAKWLSTAPKVFMVDEPTHGVDVGAKAEIYSILRTLAAQGTAILLISSELPELLTLCDRILVMQNGRLVAQLSRAEATEQEIMHYASGTKVNYA
ncbi:sugar ABC transporter ATP-binding protein [Rhodocytophaga rosea]|uniref:Sugar ABC transporter ATP-binding protein n=1 Tax=Rhodocytophaga rosea TaxID=2704465 RepID=A0A6C0GK32_9BACT|nr:sugar ABC transporter ATP-binding protein [Rhodocytophaga rosea]QHT68345.1 sugar ABC transporter ATP-binding protein [Rhodocytophaga rosea]